MERGKVSVRVRAVESFQLEARFWEDKIRNTVYPRTGDEERGGHQRERALRLRPSDLRYDEERRGGDEHGHEHGEYGRNHHHRPSSFEHLAPPGPRRPIKRGEIGDEGR